MGIFGEGIKSPEFGATYRSNKESISSTGSILYFLAHFSVLFFVNKEMISSNLSRSLRKMYVSSENFPPLKKFKCFNSLF